MRNVVINYKGNGVYNASWEEGWPPMGVRLSADYEYWEFAWRNTSNGRKPPSGLALELYDAQDAQKYIEAKTDKANG